MQSCKTVPEAPTGTMSLCLTAAQILSGRKTLNRCLTVVVRMLLLLPALSFAVDSDGYYIYKPDWSGGSGAWADGPRWYDGVAPSENCKVKIGNGAVAEVSDEDMAIVEKLAEIRLHTENSVIQFNVSGDYHLPCPVYHYGKIVKNGTGSLYFDNVAVKAYETTHGIVVNEGALYLPKLAAASTSDHFVGPLSVNKPGRLYLFDGAPTYAAGISGDGAVSNLCTVTTYETYRRLKIYGGSKDAPYEFTGSLGNNISYMNFGGHQYFRRDNDTSSRTVRLYGGTLGLSAMSQSDGDSISRASDFHIRGSGTAENRLKYIGNGDCELTHQIKIYDDAKNFILDSGCGTLNVNGSFQASDFSKKMTRLTLDGERDGRGVFNVPISEDDAYATYLIKKGAGAWRMAANGNQLNGVIEVQSGTLEFTSLAERGELCALGRQNILHENYVGEKVNKAVDYAVRLGNGDEGVAADTGTLAYVGDNAASCSTRPIVVDGSGRLSNEGAGSLDWSGISPIGNGDATIVLAGSAQDSIARSVVDDTGRISVVKEGSGNWTLKGNMKVSGSIESKGGALRVANSGKFRWYRFNIRDTWKDVCVSNGVTEIDNAVLLRGFALIAADNPSSNIMYAAVYNSSANGKPQLLAPGEVCYANADNEPVLSYRDLDKLFGHSTFQAIASASTPNINPDDESTWVRIAMRVPENAAEVVKYDIRAGTNGSSTTNDVLKTVPFCREVRSWSIDGSSDGETWETLVSEERDVSNMTPLSNSHWYSSKSTANMSGMSIPRDEYATILKNVSPSAVGVSGRGALSFDEAVEVSAFRFTAREGGRIANVKILPDGTIDVAAVGSEYGELPVVFENVSGLENLRSYKLTVNGRDTFSKISLIGGKLSIVPPGLSIHIR